MENNILKKIKESFPSVKSMKMNCYLCNNNKCNDDIKKMQTIDDYNKKNVKRGKRDEVGTFSANSFLIFVLVIANLCLLWGSNDGIYIINNIDYCM